MGEEGLLIDEEMTRINNSGKCQDRLKQVRPNKADAEERNC
jgi:hypothetical protein